MEERERISYKQELQQEIDELSSMIEERKLKLQTINGPLENSTKSLLQHTTSNSCHIIMKNVGNSSALNMIPSESFSKCPSHSKSGIERSNKTVIIESNKPQPVFKIRDNVIINTRTNPINTRTNPIFPHSTSKATSIPANNVFINPNFKKSQNSVFFNSSALNSSNVETKRLRNESQDSSYPLQSNSTRNGIHVNPYFRNVTSKKNLENGVTNSIILNQNSKTRNDMVPYSGSSFNKLESDACPTKQQSTKLYLNPNLIQKSSQRSSSDLKSKVYCREGFIINSNSLKSTPLYRPLEVPCHNNEESTFFLKPGSQLSSNDSQEEVYYRESFIQNSTNLLKSIPLYRPLDVPCHKNEKPTTYIEQSKRVQMKEPFVENFYKVNPQSNELLKTYSNVKLPLSSRNSQDCIQQNRNITSMESKTVPDNFHETGEGRNVLTDDTSSNSNSRLMGAKFKANGKVGQVTIVSNGVINKSVPLKPQNNLLNRGYTWTSASSNTKNKNPKAPNRFRLSKVQSQLSNNQFGRNNLNEKSRTWIKSPASNSSMGKSLRRTSDHFDDPRNQFKKSVFLSTKCQESIPGTSKSALIAVSRTKLIRKTKASPKVLGTKNEAPVEVSSDIIKNSNLSGKFKATSHNTDAFSRPQSVPLLYKTAASSTSKTPLIAISRTKVIRKSRVSSITSSNQYSNPRKFVANRNSLKIMKQKASNHQYASSSRIDLLKINSKVVNRSYTMQKKNQQLSCLRTPLRQPNQPNVGSRLKFVAEQRRKSLNSKESSQTASRLISLSRNKLIREGSINFKPPIKRTQIRNSAMQFVNFKNNRPVNRCNSLSHITMYRNRYSLARDRFRVRRQTKFHPQTFDTSRLKYRNLNVAGRRHSSARSNFMKQHLSRDDGFKSSGRKRMKSVTIEGIKYHSSRLKLRRRSSVKDLKVNQNQVVSVRGEKFEIGNGGRTLKRVGEGPLRLNKVYLGGIAFIRSKENDSTMQRTNTHNIRQMLRQAKQRSIAQLTKKMRKNNEPCPFFHRFGKCSGKEKGTCNRVHDKKHVAVCKKFLRGDCDKKNCLLSHDICFTKMPTCRHYLAGVCMRENCPYLHVKLSNSAPICLKFLQGYCPDAEKCKNRHIEICPEYEATGKCSKGKYCPHPHPKNYQRTSFSSFQTSKTEKDNENGDIKPLEQTERGEALSDKNQPDSNAMSRYYMALNENSNITEVSPTPITHELTEDKEDDGCTSWLKSRPKLGQLEGFIPFDKS